MINHLLNPIMRSIVLAGLVVAAASLFTARADAHFIWVSAADGEVRIVFSEGPTPDQAVLLDHLAGLEAWQVAGDQLTRLQCAKRTDGQVGWLACPVDAARGPIEVDFLYGVITRDDGPMLLNYSAKYVRSDHPPATRPSERQMLEVLTTMVDDRIRLEVYLHGKPYAGSTVVIAGDGIEPLEVTTDDRGAAQFAAPAAGRVHIRARADEASGGTADGEAFDSRRYYSTVVYEIVPSEAPRATSVTASTDGLTDLPVGLTSFGGAAADGKLFVFGGQMGGAHEYSRTTQSPHLYMLDLAAGGEWQTLSEGPSMQGLALVAHNGRLVRIGGFQARNDEGQPQDLHSTAECAVFDVATRQWQSIEPLPQARSSFDACVIDDLAYVVGGWTLRGEEESVWAETALSCDLSKPNAAWTELAPPPFRRRALAVGHQAGTLVAIGGIEESGDISNAVALYDLAAGEWRDGPPLPAEGPMEGFGSACCNVDGRLVVSTYGGGVYQLSEDFSQWDKIHQLDHPRFFHRILPGPDRQVFVVGGANMETGKVLVTEVFTLPAR
jgi:hypothetical protein